MRIHPVFHISLLEPAPLNAKLDTTTNAELNQEYEVKQILDLRQHNRRQEYLIK